jgi:hypothetical protein
MTLRRKDPGLPIANVLEACAQCGKVLVPQGQVGSCRVLGHGRDFCSMACADAWEPTCDCGCMPESWLWLDTRT